MSGTVTHTHSSLLILSQALHHLLPYSSIPRGIARKAGRDPQVTILLLTFGQRFEIFAHPDDDAGMSANWSSVRILARISAPETE